MAHHKRKRPKNRRAGCLLCKPYKMNGWSKEDAKDSDRRRMKAFKQDMKNDLPI